MSEELFFKNDDGDEFIDSWLKEAGEDASSATPTLTHSATTTTTTSEVRLGNDARNKFGLGFESGGASGGVGKGASKEQNDALMERIKKRKAAAKEDRKNANKDWEEHGVIEEELEGRGAVASKVTKVKKAAVAVAMAGKNLGGGKGKNGNKIGESKSSNSNTVSNGSGSGNGNGGNSKEMNSNKQKQTNGEGGETEQPFVKRKRPKTRSKQKNIRRDKRDTAFLPEHLKIGSDKYTGRPLTDETKKFMGINK